MAHNIVYDVILGATTVRQVTGSGHNPNAETMYGEASGASVASAIYGKKAAPVSQFTTMDLYTLFGLSSLLTAGQCGTGTAFTMPWHSRLQCSDFAGSSAHTTLSSSYWHAVVDQITMGKDQDPEATMSVHHRSTDGETDPVSINQNQTLAAQAYNSDYAFAAAEVNSTAIPECEGAVLRPAVRIEKDYSFGLPYPTETYAVEFRPVLELRFRNFASLANFNASFTSLTDAYVKCRKRSGTGFVAAGSSVHLSMGVAGGLTVLDNIDAKNKAAGIASVTMMGLTASYSRTATIS